MLFTGISRLANSGASKMWLTIGESLFSTATKYVVSKGGQVYTGVVGEILLQLK